MPRCTNESQINSAFQNHFATASGFCLGDCDTGSYTLAYADQELTAQSSFLSPKDGIMGMSQYALHNSSIFEEHFQRAILEKDLLVFSDVLV